MRKLSLIVLMLGLLGGPAGAAANADYEHAMRDYDRGAFAEAIPAFRLLAERGDAQAEFMLGAMYFFGKGVRRNDAIAAIWFAKAASKGDANAQLAFGSLHINGLGVPQDLVKAYMWLTIAADRGVPTLRHRALSLRDDAARLMQPAQVDAAQARARAWRPSEDGFL